jgi:hypothetical protein
LDDNGFNSLKFPSVPAKEAAAGTCVMDFVKDRFEVHSIFSYQSLYKISRSLAYPGTVSQHCWNLRRARKPGVVIPSCGK